MNFFFSQSRFCIVSLMAKFVKQQNKLKIASVFLPLRVRRANKWKTFGQATRSPVVVFRRKASPDFPQPSQAQCGGVAESKWSVSRRKMTPPTWLPVRGAAGDVGVTAGDYWRPHQMAAGASVSLHWRAPASLRLCPTKHLCCHNHHHFRERKTARQRYRTSSCDLKILLLPHPGLFIAKWRKFLLNQHAISVIT